MKQTIRTILENKGGVITLVVSKERPFIQLERYTRNELIEYVEYYKALLEQFDNGISQAETEITIIKE